MVNHGELNTTYKYIGLYKVSCMLQVYDLDLGNHYTPILVASYPATTVTSKQASQIQQQHKAKRLQK